MGTPLTPNPGLEASQPPHSSPSPSSTRRFLHPSDCPLSPNDKKTESHPIGAMDKENASAASKARLETPAPEDGPGKSLKSSKRKKHRRRKRHNRHQSFLTPSAGESYDQPRSPGATGGARELTEGTQPTSKDKPPHFNLGRNLSDASIESDALLDHRLVYISFNNIINRSFF